MEYKDFNIRIMSKRDDGYEVSVDSPAGSANDTIKLPFEIEDALKRIRDMGGVTRSGNGDGATREVAFEAEDVVTPAEFGAELYQALFSGTVGKMYNRSYAALMENPDVGLRIKLHMNLDDPDVSELAQIPWEYVYEADTMEYLTLSRQTPIVRYIEVQRGLSAHKLQGDLRILVVMSSPEGEAALDLEREREQIDKTWAKLDNVKVDFLEHPTPESLLTALSENRCHVLHYMGHGAYDEKTGAGALILEDDDRQPMMIDPQTLGAYLRDAPTVRLVFLNACDTARSDDDEPFAGVANRLVMAGVPAVVAMQFPITDEAAIDFSRAFYSRLVAGFPVDEATAQGRKAILAGSAGTMEWGTPVLYMRAPDGQLFDAPQNVATPEPVPAPELPDQSGGGAGQEHGKQAGGGGGKGSAMKGAVGGAAAVIGLIALIVWWANSGGSDFQWDDIDENTITLELGVPTAISMVMIDSNDRPIGHDQDYDIQLQPVGFETDDILAEDDEWTWTVTALSLASGAAKLEPITTYSIDGSEVGEPAPDLAVTVEVGQNATNVHGAAIAAFASETATLDEVIAAYAAATTDDQKARQSKDMEAELESALNQYVADARGNAGTTARDQDVVLGDRIAAIDSWERAYTALRQDTPVDELLAYRETLRAIDGLENFAVCGDRDACRNLESMSTVAINTNVFVVTVPELNGLRCNFVAVEGGQSRDCNDTINQPNSRYLNVAGTYETQIRNADGDLLATHTLVAR